jgi:hypothetical protein
MHIHIHKTRTHAYLERPHIPSVQVGRAHYCAVHASVLWVEHERRSLGVGLEVEVDTWNVCVRVCVYVCIQMDDQSISRANTP